ncbi:MAG: hypothetical protein VZR23_07210 [Lachnospiraceae bacterium]|nr:hypothetical protein [Lachnospiraceae bacterium]
MMIVIFCIGIITGCGKEENETTTTSEVTIPELKEEAKNIKNFKNIDFTNTVFKLPDTNSISELTFDLEKEGKSPEETFDYLYNKFTNAIYIYTGKKPEDKNIYFKLPRDDDVINIKNVTNEDLKKSEPQSYFLSYNDGKNSLLLYGSSYMCEMADEMVSSKYKSTVDWVGFRPEDTTLAKSYDLEKDDISNEVYKVNGEDVSIQEAVSFVENELKKTLPFLSSEFLTYKVFRVEVYRLADDDYYYKMSVRALYDGISFQYENNAVCFPADKKADYNDFSENTTVTLMEKDKINYFWSCSHTYDNIKVGKTYDKFISLRKACSLLSDKISKYQEMNCESVELMYRTAFRFKEVPDVIDDEKVQSKVTTSIWCYPVYCFKFTKTHLPEYPVLYFLVDAINGEVQSSKPN